MGLFDWWTSGKKAGKRAQGAPGATAYSELSRIDSTRPPGSRSPGPSSNGSSSRRQQRISRRELLYAVIRECMANSGVVSASYKFKVLSLDAGATQFLAMVDLLRDVVLPPSKLTSIERTIATSAKERYGMTVTAVYWRSIDAPAAKKPVHNPKPVSPPATRVAEPLQIEEVAAFARALAAARGTPRADKEDPRKSLAKAFEGTPAREPRSFTLLDGFGDTDLKDPTARLPALSTSQYGDLR